MPTLYKKGYFTFSLRKLLTRHLLFHPETSAAILAFLGRGAVGVVIPLIVILLVVQYTVLYHIYDTVVIRHVMAHIHG